MSHDKGFFDELITQRSSQNVDQSNDAVTADSATTAMNVEAMSAENSLQQAEGAPRVSMPPEARRALVSLLRQGVILSAQKPKLFLSVCRYQTEFRRHLSDMYLRLVLDEKTGVSFVANIDSEQSFGEQNAVVAEPNNATDEFSDDEESVSLIIRRTLSLFDTLLLLVLRKHYQERETSGEQKVVIDVERVESNLSPFLPLTNSSKNDRKKLHAALQKLVQKRVLRAVRGSDDRFEISPIIRYVVNAAFLESMLAEYHRLSIDSGLESPEKVIEESENSGLEHG